MSDLVVDYNLLDQTERSLSRLHSEFSNIKAQDRTYFRAWGSADIASAMEEFAGNWDHHRRKLLDSMQALGQMVSQSKSSFAKADSDLSTALIRHK